MFDAKIVLECYLVTWMDKVCEMLSKHLLRAHPDKLLDVVAGKDHLPARPNHEAEAVEAGEKVEGIQLIVFLFVLRRRRPPLQLWVWCIGQNFIFQSLISDRPAWNSKLEFLSGPVNPLLDANSRRKMYLDLVYFTLMKIPLLTVS